VISIKEDDAAITSDFWKVVVEFKLATNEKVIEILRANLAAVTELVHPTPLVDEVHQVQTAVNSLDSTLTNLKRFCRKRTAREN